MRSFVLHPHAPDLSHVPDLNPEKHNSRSREDFHRLSGCSKSRIKTDASWSGGSDPHERLKSGAWGCQAEACSQQMRRGFRPTIVRPRGIKKPSFSARE